MKYRDQLNEFSEYILNMKQELPASIKKEPLRSKIYQRNYLQLAFNNFLKDFPATLKYLGDDNFLFFTREFLLQVGLKSPSIFQASEKFLFFLKNNFETHKDLIIFDLALIDFTWVYAKISNIKVYEGILDLWLELMRGDPRKSLINFNKLVDVEIFEKDNEQMFRVRK